MITRSARVDEALDLRLLACGLVHLTAFPPTRFNFMVSSVRKDDKLLKRYAPALDSVARLLMYKK